MALPIIEKLKATDRLFVALVIVPVILSTIYFGIFATDVYVSESKFVVRSPDKPAASGLGMILAGAGFTNAAEEAFASKSFVESRDALKHLNRGNAFEAAFTRPHIWMPERFNSLGFSGSFEDLYKYYSKRVLVETDITTSISTLTVRAYTADDAYRINERLLEMSEQTINRMNARGRSDMIRFATVEVEDAEARAFAAAKALAAYRTRAGVVDPELQATAQMEMISKLQDEAITTRAQLNQLRAFTPLNPQIPALENRSQTIQDEIYKQMGSLTGGKRSLAATAVEYQRRFLENSFADKQLTSALASLQEARNEARRQQVYVERIVQPNRPDAALEPRRIRGILATLALGLVAWCIASMLVAGVKEHGQ